MHMINIAHARAQLYRCACADLHKHVPPASVDVILTDPPYGKEAIPCYRQLRDFAVHALRPGGHLLTMFGNAWLPEVLQALHCPNKGIRYQWTLSQRIQGRNAGCLGRRICRIAYKPLLWYVKPPSDVHVQMPDEFDAGGRDKRYHYWGQNVNELKCLLQYLVEADAVVADPFVGGGTTAIAAAELDCQFIGADLDYEALNTTEYRLNTLQQQIPLSI